MPYRIDLANPPAAAFDMLVDLGALDIELAGDGLAAVMPDVVPIATIANAVGVNDVRVSPAVGRDDDSVWALSLRSVHVGSFLIVPHGLAAPPPPGAITLADAPAFGTGLHATTALCLEAIDKLVNSGAPDRMLDVGTGSGILALAALTRGTARAVAIDTDPAALRAAAVNAALNGFAERLSLVLGGADSVDGRWPLVAANIRAAELIEMAPQLVQRVASQGHLVISGIPHSVAPDVERTYRRLGMSRVGITERDGWTAHVFASSW